MNLSVRIIKIKLINLLYCFDEKYNFQAFSSIVSVLDKVTCKVNLYIIHKIENKNDFVPPMILEHQSLNKIKVKKFNIHNFDFPNIEGTHVTEATYYRIFFENYIDENVDFLLYLDADIICKNDFATDYVNIKSEMKNSKKIIAAATEISRKEDEEIFKRIGMKSSLYFNAGVLFIDVHNWKKHNVGKQLQNYLKILDFEIIYWDQDILNKCFDGNFFEIDRSLNSNIFLDENKEIVKNKINNAKLIHFYGKTKPWVGKGLYIENSEIYQEQYRKLKINYFHIEHRWRINSIYLFIKNFFNLNFFNKKYKYKFILEMLRSLRN